MKQAERIARRRRQRRRALIGAALTVALLGGGAYAVAQVQSASAAADRYVTAVATTGPITQTLAGTGEMTKVDSAGASFPAAGTVTSVLVWVGEEVEAGDELARMATTDLDAAVDEAVAGVAEAELALEEAEDAEDESSSSTSSTGSSAGGSASSASGAAGGATPSAGATASPTATPTATNTPDPTTSPSATATPTATDTPDPTSTAAPIATATATTTPTATAEPSTASTAHAKDLATLQQELADAREELDGAWSAFAKTLVSASATCSAATGSAPLAPPATPAAAAKDASTDDSGTADSPVDVSPTPTPSTESSTAAPSPEATATTEPAEAATTPSATPEPTETAAGLSAGVDGSAVLLSSTTTVEDCVTALAGLGAAQAEVTQAQTEVDDGIDALVAYASTASSGSASSGSGASGTASSGSVASGSSGGSAGSTGSSQAGGSSAGTSSNRTGSGGTTSVAVAEADLAEAELALTDARLARANATLTAPISGTVAEVPFVKGEAMTTSDAITIVGPGAVQVTIDVNEGSILDVEVGQAADVAASSGSTSEGIVTAIGMLPSSTGTSSVTYPVTVTVDAPGSGLAQGTTGSVSVTVASAEQAVLVPISALTRTGDDSGTVSLLGSDLSVTTTRVTIGAVGATHVQITDGLSAGDTVVLADRTADLPSSNLTNRMRSGGSSLTGGSGGLPPGALGGSPGGRPRG